MSVANVMKLIIDNDIKFVDFRFTDTRGKEQHTTVPISAFNEEKFTEGHAFDGSSIAGWKGIQASDMQLMPDPSTANIDPFMDEPTLILTCDVVDPTDGKGYDRDPRSIAKRAEAYLKSSGIGDTASLFLIVFLGMLAWVAAQSKSIQKKPHGNLATHLKVVTQATVQESKAVTSQYLQSIR